MAADYGAFADLVQGAGGAAAAPAPADLGPFADLVPADSKPHGFLSNLGTSLYNSLLVQTPQLAASALEGAADVMEPDTGPAAAGTMFGSMVGGKDAPDLSQGSKNLRSAAAAIRAHLPTPYAAGETQTLADLFSKSKGLGDFASRAADYAGSTIGQMVGSSGTSLVSGTAASLITRNPAVGFFAGAALPSYVQNYGDTIDYLRADQDVQKAIASGQISQKKVAQIAAAFSVPMAALDSVGEGFATRLGLSFKEWKGNLLKRAVKQAIAGGLVEGSTEGLQQGFEEAANDTAGSNKSLGAQAWNMLESAMGGLLGGTAMGVSAPGKRASETPATPPPPTGGTTFIPGEGRGFAPRETVKPIPPEDRQHLQGHELLTAEDLASPIPNDVIAKGKALVADATGTRSKVEAEAIASRANLATSVARQASEDQQLESQLASQITPVDLAPTGIATPAQPAAPPTSAAEVAGTAQPPQAGAPVAAPQASPENFGIFADLVPGLNNGQTTTPSGAIPQNAGIGGVVGENAAASGRATQAGASAPGTFDATQGAAASITRKFGYATEARKSTVDLETLRRDRQISDAVHRMESIPRTELRPGYATAEDQATRQYNFGTDAKPEPVVGTNNAIERLTEGAKTLAARETGAEPHPVTNGYHAVIVIGPPAAGKSTIANEIALRSRAAIVDPDEAKKVLPEYQGGIGAHATHEESSALAGAVQRVLEGDGTNMVLPKVGDSAEKIDMLRKRLQGLGYTVELALMDVSPDVAMQRMIGRFRHTGRLIDPTYFAHASSRPKATYQKLLLKGQFHGYSRIESPTGLPARSAKAKGRTTFQQGEVLQRGGVPRQAGPAAGTGGHELGQQRQAAAPPVASIRRVREGKENPQAHGPGLLGLPLTKQVGKLIKKVSRGTREVVEALERRQRERFGTIARDDRSPKAKNKIANWIADEVAFEMQPGRQDQSGAGWYSWKYQRALDAFGQHFPELIGSKVFKGATLPGLQILKTQKNARDFLTALIAITSDGQKVMANFSLARQLYDAFRLTGRVPTDFIFGGKSNAGMRINAQNINQLLATNGPSQMHQMMLHEETVSELNQRAKTMGLPFKVKYQAHIRMPLAAVIFGPKLGAFYSNLMGSHGYLTMDRWWSRTFNRYRGQLLAKVSGTADRPTDTRGNLIGLAKFKEMLGSTQNMSDEEALIEAFRAQKTYEAKGFKNGTDLEKFGNTLAKDAVGIEDMPFNSKDRTFMIETTALAQQKLAAKGVDISIADIQAVLWYFEKRLYGELGARQTADISYEDAAARVVGESGRNGPAERAGRSEPAGPAGRGPAEARASSVERPAEPVAKRRAGQTQGLVAATPDEFIQARNASSRPGFLSPLSSADIADHQLFISPDRTYGVAVDPNGDVQNVFNNGGPKGSGAKAVVAAIENGGRTLDAYDGFLPEFYRQFGFVETGRMSFNPDFAPDGWTGGTPDVVFMAWQGYPDANAEAAINRASSRANWIANEQTANRATDFDAAKQQSREAAQQAGTGAARLHGPEKGPGVGEPARGADLGTGEASGRAVAFKAWFGDSKVVDAKGKPLVVYHGTQRAFDAFDPSAYPVSMGGDTLQEMGGAATFFSKDQDVAQGFANLEGDGEPRVIGAYLSIQNPLEIDAKGQVFSDFNQRIIDAKVDGHDGVILRNVVDGYTQLKPTDVYAVFKPTQIKSAIANIGTFSPTNPDITQKRRAAPAEQPIPESVREISDRLRASMDKLGLHDVGLMLHERLKLIVSGKPMDADGIYFQKLVHVALDQSSDEVTRTLLHEALHALRDVGAFTKTEWAILAKQAADKWIKSPAEGGLDIEESYAGVPRWMMLEEGVAHAFDAWAGGRLQVTGTVERIFMRIKDILAGIRVAVTGVQGWEDVFREIESGKIGARPRAGIEPSRQVPFFSMAWHGSGARFDRFSHDFMGTGEGHQAFGWGTYLADVKELGQHYREIATRGKKYAVTWNGKTADQLEGTAREGLAAVERTGSISEAIAQYGSAPFEYRDFEEITNWIDRHQAEIEINKAGALYKVDIPDAHELLDWDKPLREQPEMVDRVLAALGTTRDGAIQAANDYRAATAAAAQAVLDHPDAKKPWDRTSPEYRALADKADAIRRTANVEVRIGELLDSMDTLPTNEFGRDMAKNIVGETLYRALSRGLTAHIGVNDRVGDRAASEFLRDAAGIPGHRFLEGRSRAAGEGNYNYVIYDEGRMNITEAVFKRRGLNANPAATGRTPIPPSIITSVQGRILRYLNGRNAQSPDTSIGDWSMRKIVDYLDPLKRMIDEAGPAGQADAVNAYREARLALDAAVADIQDAHARFVTPAVDALANVGASLGDLQTYLYAKHAEERNRVVGLRNQPGTQLHAAATNPAIVGASGWSTNHANAEMQRLRGDLRKFQGIVQAGRLFRQMIDENLLAMRRSGLISDATYTGLTQQWKNYVPLHGDEAANEEGNFQPGAGRGFDVRGKDIKGATGRSTEAKDIAGWSIATMERSKLRQHKNEVGKAILRFIQRFDPTGTTFAEVYWSENPTALSPITKAQPVYRRELDKNGMVVNKAVPYSAISPEMYAVKVGGKTFYVKFADAKVGQALKNMNATSLNLVLSISRRLTNWQSLVNTRANPAFIPTNFFRDTLTAAIHLADEGFNSAEITKIMAGIPAAQRAVWRAAKGKAPQGPMGAALAEMTQAGGRLIFDQQRTVEESIDALRNKMTMAAAGSMHPKVLWDAFVKVIEDVNDTVEMGVRLSSYAAMRDKGATVKDASLRARDLTVDFRKHGEIGPAGNALFAFFNASVQGNFNVGVRLMRSRKVQAAAAVIMLGGFLMDALNRALSGDDDDGEDIYAKMLRNEPWKFERQMVIFYGPTKDSYFTIPMPYGYNAIYHTGLQLGAVFNGDMSPLEGISNSMRVLADAFNPMGGGSGWFNMLMPTVFKPALEIETNTNFANQPIYPTQQHGDTTPDSWMNQFTKTPDVFRWLAQKMNAATGGDDVEPGALDVHPETIEHMYDFVSGGIGRFLGSVYDPAQKALTGHAADIAVDKLPFIRSFYGEHSTDNQRSEYYKERELVSNASDMLDKRKADHDPVALADFNRRYKTEIQSINAFDNVEKQLKVKRKLQRKLEALGGHEDQIKAINDTMDLYMAKARKAYARNRRQNMMAGG